MEIAHSNLIGKYSVALKTVIYKLTGSSPRPGTEGSGFRFQVVLVYMLQVKFIFRLNVFQPR